jgi:tetratricopeptide (TPR) repeat protein
MAEKPLCFVLMPFGNKKDPGGGPDIGFDAIYDQAIRPAIEGAGMEPVRADEERTGGIIHKPMYERLLLCDYAVADLTTANPNVYYELGIRHAARPATTLAIFARQQMLPFDVNFLRALPYELGDGNRFSAREADLLRSALQNRLRELRDYALEEGATDSPLFQLLSDYRPPDIARLKTDVFREQVQYSMRLKRELAKARSREDSAEVSRIEESLGSHLDGVEAGVLVDLLLSYRALEQWNKMVDLYDRLPATLKRSVMVREQFAFALNRLKERRQALEVLEEVVAERGPSSETMGLIGRVYKDLWAETYRKGNAIAARGYLDKAIDAYVRGFEADWRDAYPGINAITLLDIRGDEGSLARKAELLPVVRFSVNQRLKSAKPDYWDHATLVEIAVLEGNAQAAGQHLSDAIASIREPWEPKTTANNLSLIREARHDRGIEEGWVNDIVTALENENAHRIKR